MNATDLMRRPVGELARMVRDGTLSSRELVEASLARIEQLDGKLNAFTEVDGERAIAAAEEVQPGDPRPFAGVPIAIKNNRALAGWRLTYGSKLMGEHVAKHDHNVVRRLKDAGFVVVGTTNLPEFGILPVTEPKRFGPTRNPWDLERTPGGSSGGGAAAVAAGMVPVAHANDGGGSIRIPASCTGLVGLRAQRGRVSQAPELGDHPLLMEGVVTRTVAETAELLDVLAGYERGDATWAPPPAEPFATAAAREPSPLRVGIVTRPPRDDVTVQPAYLDATRRAGELLESLGHEVEEVEAPWDASTFLPLFAAVYGMGIALSVTAAGRIAGREPQREDVEHLSWWLYERAQEAPAVPYAISQALLGRESRKLIEGLWDWDVVLTPALAEPPLRIGALDTEAEDAAATFSESGRFTPFTAILNATGQPGLSLPLFQDDDGLPLAVQLVGRPAEEHVLLQVGAQLEAAHPWADRRPALAEAATTA